MSSWTGTAGLLEICREIIDLLLKKISTYCSVLESVLAESGINYYYFASFLIIVAAVLIKLPSLVVSAEFYAETATIFFKQAREATLWQILTYTWADYLVTFQLLVSFVLVRLFGVIGYFPGTVNFIFLLFISFSASLINLRMFRELIDSDFLRFMIGVSIGLTPNHEVYQLLHANIFGFMIYFLFIFVDKQKINRLLFIFLLLLLFLVGVARPNLVVFLPVYLVLLFMAVRSGKKRDIIFYSIGIVSLALQSYVMIMARLYWSVRRNTGIYNDITGMGSLIKPLDATIYHYFRTLLGVLLNRQVDGTGHIIILTVISFILILLGCYYLYRKKKYSILYFFCISQVIVIGLIYFVTFTSPVEIDWNKTYFDLLRWWLYSNYIMYLSLMVLAYNVLKRLPSGLSVVALSLFAVHFSIYNFYHYKDPFGGHNSLSNWARYRHLLKENNYYIPTNPVQYFQWGIWKDNERLRTDVQIDGVVNGIKLSETEGDLNLRSILVINYDYYNSMKDLIIKAYNNEGKEIAIPDRLNDFRDKYLYYYFTERTHPYRILFFNEKMQRINVRPDLYLFGKLTTGETIVITRF